MSEERIAENSLGASHQLLQAVRSGDNSALGKLADGLRPFLKYVIRNEVGFAGVRPQDDASDLVQQTLVAAIENIESFRGRSLAEWRGWLAAIARNEVNMASRYWKAARRDTKRALKQTNMGQNFVANIETPSAAAGEREEVDKLREVVSALSSEQQQLFVWRHEQGLSHAQIANRLGITEEASRQRCKAAMDALRAAWRRVR